MNCQNGRLHGHAILINGIRISLLIAYVAAAFLYVQSAHFNLFNADLFYLPTLLASDPFQFRLTPPSYLFPDLIYYSFAKAMVGDSIKALSAAGVLQLAATSVLLLRFFGFIPFSLCLSAIFIISPIVSFAITCHHNVIMFVLLLLKTEKLRPWVAVLGGIADALFLIPVSFLIFSEALCDRKIRLGDIAAIFIAWSIAFFLCETAKQLLLLLPILVIIVLLSACVTVPYIRSKVDPITSTVVSKLLTRKVRKPKSFIVGCLCVASVICAYLFNQPDRYFAPMICAAILFLSDSTAAHPLPWRESLAYSCLLAVGFIAFIRPQIEEMNARAGRPYECLYDRLSAADFDSIGADYWTSKPLFQIARKHPNRSKLSVLQVDFRDGSAYVWISPYDFARGTFSYVVQDQSTCNPSMCPLQRCDPTHCSDQWLRQVRSHEDAERVCGRFALTKLREPVTYAYDRNKLQSFGFNFARDLARAKASPEFR